jgi:hypothetical protein
MVADEEAAHEVHVGVVVHADSDDDQALRRELLGKVNEQGIFLAAGLAPSGPEIHEQRLTAVLGENLIVSGKIDKRRIRDCALCGARRSFLRRCGLSRDRAANGYGHDEDKENYEAKERMKSAKKFAQVAIPHSAILRFGGLRGNRREHRTQFAAAGLRVGGMGDIKNNFEWLTDFGYSGCCKSFSQEKA